MAYDPNHLTEQNIIDAATVQNDQLTFPYPEVGGVMRPPGQGCTTCVHDEYCTALYYFRRYTQREPDNNNGRNCMSWSNDPRDKITKWSQHDYDENNRLTVLDPILTEPNRNGITTPTTGAPDKSPF